MKLLKQKWSGEIFVWTPQLAARDDMEEFVKAPVVTLPPTVIREEQEVREEPTQAEPDIAEMAAAVLKKKTRK